MKVKKNLLVGLLPIFLSSNILAWTTETSDDVWRSGWGQGISESEVTYGSGNRIYVACHEPLSWGGSSISISLGGMEFPNSELLIRFDNGKLESFHTDKRGYIESDSRVGDAQFHYLIDHFKKHKKVYIRAPNGYQSTFTLKGSTKALGSDCKSGFSY
ncbi:hypothetical protein [Acinetobacter radioresistens]|uniref:hypothetical protein n=1 Tax=Acinetobacter radioresistens TaxID=40216 RepID=UPI003215F9EB